MGAADFFSYAVGDTPEQAFDDAVIKAQHDFGHSGYSGTIAEKDTFCMIDVPEGREPHDYAGCMLQDDDPRINDKWGDAGCIKLGDKKYLFFGWASS